LDRWSTGDKHFEADVIPAGLTVTQQARRSRQFGRRASVCHMRPLMSRAIIVEPTTVSALGFLIQPIWRNAMNSLSISLAVAASALFATAASAAPLSADVLIGPGSNLQNVRMLCNENGRCWRERGEGRVVIREPRDSYGYAPRERYIERRGYDEDRGGVGFRAPGVSVGIGTDRY
jgi:hypothetical protein